MDEARKTMFVLVADAGRARLFRRDEDAGKLVLLEEMEHPSSRARNRDLVADKPGRAFTGGHTGGNATNGRSAMEYGTDPQEVEDEKFARALGDKLAQAFDAHSFDALVLIAPPKFLGRLRQTLDTHTDHVSRRVTACFDKDYTELTAKEIAERIFAAEKAA